MPTGPDGWLTFVGPSGSGKTYLAAAVANRRIELGEPALFITAADLVDFLRSGFDEDSDLPFVDLFEQVRHAPLLVLDDLPTRPATPWTQERLFQLLASRHAERLSTVITLRGDPNRLDEFFDNPTGSRRMVSGRLYRLGRVSGGVGSMVGAIPPGMRERMTFDTFDPTCGGEVPEEETRSLQSAKSYVQRWAGQSEWLAESARA